MTAIVAVEHADGVTIGSDSLLSTSVEHWVEAAPKYFQLGDLVLGLAGGTRVALVAETITAPRRPRPGERDVVWLATVVAEAIRTACDAVDCEHNVEGVLVWRGRAYYLDAGYAVLRPAGGVVGAGSGGTVARAVARALADRPPEVRVRRALELAAEVCPGVGGELHVLTIRQRARKRPAR